MRKKDSHHQNATSSKMFIINSAFKHYERERIDPTAVSNFNNLIHSISLRLLKNPTEADVVQLFKVTNDLIIGFLANLSEETYRHTCTHQDIISFFIVIASYFEKAINAFGVGDHITQSNFISIFWPLVGKTNQAAKSIDQNKIELINNLLLTIDQFKREKISFGPFVREIFAIYSQSGKKQLQIQELFKAFLRNSGVVINFKPALMKYLTVALTQNLQTNFKKGLSIYQHMGSTFQQRRIALQNLLIKTLDFNNCISFLPQFESYISLSKLISSVNVPLIVTRITQKLFAKSNINSSCLKILQELSQINVIQLKEGNNDKVFSKNQNLVVQFLEWVLSRYLKKEQNQAIEVKANQLRQKMLEEPQFKEQRFLEFVKKLSHKNGQGDEEKNSELRKVCQYFGRFIKNICRHNSFKQKLAIKDLDSLALFKHSDKWSNTIIRDFIMEIIPPLVDELNFNCKDKSPLKYAIMLRVAEIHAQKSAINGKSVQPFFKEIFFQMLQNEALNYHYALCFIFLKYENEKEEMREIIVDSVISQLEKEGDNKNCRNLILTLSLFLKSFDNLLVSQPIRYKMKNLTKNIEILTNKLDINQLFGTQPKEYISMKQNGIEFKGKVVKMKKLLNQLLSNFSNKDNLNLFYSIILAVNDVIQIQDEEQNQHSLLSQITSLRRKSRLGEISTNIHVLNQTLQDILSKYEANHPKLIETFLLLLRIFHLTKKNELKETEDTQSLSKKLSEQLLLMNRTFDSYLLQKLVEFKTNPDKFSLEQFQTYIEDKQIIKFYSETSKDLYQMHILLSKVGLIVLNKLIQLKKIEVSSLSQDLKNLFLLYFSGDALTSFGYTKQHELALKNYLSVLHLAQKVDKKMSLQATVKKMMPNTADIRNVLLDKHAQNTLEQFKKAYPVNFFKLCENSIKQLLVSDEKDNEVLFDFVNKVIEEDNKQCSCLSKELRSSLEEDLSSTICQKILNRAKKGLELTSKTTYFSHSLGLYKLISRALEKNKAELLMLVEELVQLDYYSDSEQSAFILKQISCIFTFLEERNSQIIQCIFNYILTLTEIFVGDEKLQISTFICNFFGLQLNAFQELNLDALEKPVTLSCSSYPNYKCMKCDEKKVICLACAQSCHENHPVCFLNIPIELKFAKCMCSEYANNPCQYKKSQNNKLAAPIKPKEYIGRLPRPGQNPFGGGSSQIFQRMKLIQGGSSGYAAKVLRDNMQFPDRIEMQYLREEEMADQQMRANQWYDNIRARDGGRERDRQRERGQFFGRISGRFDFDRDEFPPGYRMYSGIGDGKGIPPPRFKPVIEKQIEKEQVVQEIVEQQFEDEDYECQIVPQINEMQLDGDQTSTILKKYVLLPKFIDLMVNFCNKKVDKTKALTNLQNWKLSLAVPPPIFKLPAPFMFKIHANGTFTFDIRKQNAIHNMSCTLIKKNIAQNYKFLLLASSTQIFVFSKQKMLNCLAQMKPTSGYNSISRHSLSFEVHSLDFSPVDKNLFCAAGLHNVTLLNINNDGHISRSSYRYNVSNFYINKIKLTKMGIFIGVDKEIRVLNYTCRQILTIRAQESNTIIRQWTIFEKAAGCQVLFVCPNGNIFTTDVLPSDEDRKQFVARVNDSRANKSGTGASIVGRDLPQIGKYLFASFKDGSNILGHLQTDQLEDMINIQLKGLKFEGKDIFTQHFIMGHADLVRYPSSDEFYLICTVKKYFPPEMSFHQGYLLAIRFKKGEKKDSMGQIFVINEDVTCEYFQVVRTGQKNFFIYSLHTDGSVLVTTLNKISKENIEQEITYIKNLQESDLKGEGDKKLSENIDMLRKSIAEHIKLEGLKKEKQIKSVFGFREGTQILKVTNDYTLLKNSETDYQFRYNSFAKILTGFSLPYCGQVTLPTRSVKCGFEVGFTQGEALYFFSEGMFKFKYVKSQEQKYARESFSNPNTHPRALQKLQRMQRLNDYHDGQRLLSSQLMSSYMGFKDDASSDIQFIGKPFDVFKTKINKFDEIFKVESDAQSSSIEKTALIIKMFLTKSLKDNIDCGQEELLQLIDSLKMIVAASSKRLFNLLKEIIVLATKVLQKQNKKDCGVGDQNYALRAATQTRLIHYFNTLKIDISDTQLNDFIQFLIQILEEDEDLMAFYVAKYSNIFMQFHRRLKKADTEDRAKALLQLYTFAYPILKYCAVPCSWMLSSICNITFAFYSHKVIRQKLYHGIKRSKKIAFQESLRNVCNNDGGAGLVEQAELLNSGIKEAVDQPKDQMMEIYNMFNRGQIDEQTLFKMISQASKLQYERQQQNQIGVEQKNQQMQQELQQEMEVEQNVINHNIALVSDLIDECTQTFTDHLELAYSRIMVLYVLSKVVDKYFEEGTAHLLKRARKMVGDLDLKAEADKHTSEMMYTSLFNRILKNSAFIQKNGAKKYPLYLELEEQVTNKLSSVSLETVPKINKEPNILGKIFKSNMMPVNIHIAYGLTSLLLYPCEATHVLLSLECYWLLPESKEFYSKKKDFSNITDGIQSGNIQKVYDIARSNPQIWQEYNSLYHNLEFVEAWIEQKKKNWQLALELLAIYYQD